MIWFRKSAVAITIAAFLVLGTIASMTPNLFLQKAYAFTFSSTKNLSNNVGLSDDPQIARSSSKLYVVWSDGTTGNGDIYFKRSNDGGSTFGSTKNLSNKTGIMTTIHRLKICY